jgi:hypothetical protein
VDEAIYESDPEAASDAGFVAGELRHAVVGNRGRLLDARRTPVSVTDVLPDLGEFELRIEAFEDRGACWRLPLWEIGRVQFAADHGEASAGLRVRLERAVEQFDRELVIPADTSVLPETQGRVARERDLARELLADLRGMVDLDDCIRRREGDQRLAEVLERFLAERDLGAVDRLFAETMVTNPGSGENVKGHAIVLAELGLCGFHGRIVRDPALFDADGSRARRGAHLIARLAFVRELWDMLGAQPPMLFRAAAVDGPLPPRSPASFVSCTFSEQVAAAHFEGGPTTQTAVLWRQVVDPSRLLMTFLETSAMNDRFREAEAVLLGDPSNLAF